MSIDCSVPCNIIFRFLNSCPTKILNLKSILQFSYEQLFELAMVLLSVSPYFFGILLIIICLLKRTNRSIFILAMILIEVRNNNKSFSMFVSK